MKTLGISPNYWHASTLMSVKELPRVTVAKIVALNIWDLLSQTMATATALAFTATHVVGQIFTTRATPRAWSRQAMGHAKQAARCGSVLLASPILLCAPQTTKPLLERIGLYQGSSALSRLCQRLFNWRTLAFVSALAITAYAYQSGQASAPIPVPPAPPIAEPDTSVSVGRAFMYYFLFMYVVPSAFFAAYDYCEHDLKLFEPRVKRRINPNPPADPNASAPVLT